jgi:hypothetical protein
MFSASPKISLYYGKTGEGKSTTATVMMYKIYLKNLKRRKKGKPEQNIYTNIKTTFPTTQITKDDLNDGKLTDGHLFLDEGSLQFNNRNYKAFSMEQQKFFRYHRKNALEIHVFSQSEDDTDKVIRSLTHNEYIVSKFLFWILVRRVHLFIGISDITKDLEKQRKMGSMLVAFFFRKYFWARWSLLFDTTQKMTDIEEGGKK